MLLEKQKWWIILITSRNIQILLLTQITKLMPAINKVHVHVCFHLSQHAKNESISQKTVVILVSLWAQTDFSGMLKIIQIYEGYDGANKMQIE